MVPQSLYQSIGEPIFVMDLDLAPERKLARESTTIVLQNLRVKGLSFADSAYNNTGIP